MRKEKENGRGKAVTMKGAGFQRGRSGVTMGMSPGRDNGKEVGPMGWGCQWA